MAIAGSGRVAPVAPAKEISLARYAAGLVGIFIWGLYGFAIDPESELGAVGRLVFALQVVGFVGLVAHEAGHALVGRLVGFRVFGVVIGVGPVLLVGDVGSARVEFRLVPVTGYTAGATSSRHAYRSRSVLFILAGPLVTATFIPLGLALLSSGSDAWGTACLLHGVIGLLANLVPQRTVVNGHQQWNDGGLLFQTLTLSRAKVTAAVAGFDDVEHHHLLIAAGPEVALDQSAEKLAATDDPAARRRHGESLLLAGRYEEARAIFAGRVIEEGLEPHQIAIAANNLAYADVMLRRDDLMAEADRWSTAALYALPDEPAVLGTRGAVLVALGRAAEGRPLLERSMASIDARTHVADTSCWLALATLDLGDVLAARQHLARARRANDACPLLPEVIERVGRADAMVVIDDLVRSGVFDDGVPDDARMVEGLASLRQSLGRRGEALLRSAARYLVEGPSPAEIDAELIGHAPMVPVGTAAVLRAALAATSESAG